jgi:glycine cleavage system H protein
MVAVCLSLPSQVNKSPYADGWLVKVEVANKGEIDSLLTPDAYRQHQAADSH